MQSVKHPELVCINSLGLVALTKPSPSVIVICVFWLSIPTQNRRSYEANLLLGTKETVQHLAFTFMQEGKVKKMTGNGPSIAGLVKNKIEGYAEKSGKPPSQQGVDYSVHLSWHELEQHTLLGIHACKACGPQWALPNLQRSLEINQSLKV